MKVLQKTIATFSLLAISLAVPVSIFAATTKAVPSASPSAVPTIEATVAPTPVATPAPQGLGEWISTHKKIDLGVLVLVIAIGYGISRLGKKGNQSPPAEEAKPEEPAEPETPASPEDQTPKEE